MKIQSILLSISLFFGGACASSHLSHPSSSIPTLAKVDLQGVGDWKLEMDKQKVLAISCPHLYEKPTEEQLVCQQFTQIDGKQRSILLSFHEQNQLRKIEILFNSPSSSNRALKQAAQELIDYMKTTWGTVVQKDGTEVPSVELLLKRLQTTDRAASSSTGFQGLQTPSSTSPCIYLFPKSFLDVMPEGMSGNHPEDYLAGSICPYFVKLYVAKPTSKTTTILDSQNRQDSQNVDQKSDSSIHSNPNSVSMANPDSAIHSSEKETHSSDSSGASAHKTTRQLETSKEIDALVEKQSFPKPPVALEQLPYLRSFHFGMSREEILTALERLRTDPLVTYESIDKSKDIVCRHFPLSPNKQGTLIFHLNQKGDSLLGIRLFLTEPESSFLTEKQVKPLLKTQIEWLTKSFGMLLFADDLETVVNVKNLAKKLHNQKTSVVIIPHHNNSPASDWNIMGLVTKSQRENKDFYQIEIAYQLEQSP